MLLYATSLQRKNITKYSHIKIFIVTQIVFIKSGLTWDLMEFWRGVQKLLSTNCIVPILCGLFNAFCKHSFVASNILYGKIVPVPKKCNEQFKDFRPVTNVLTEWNYFSFVWCRNSKITSITWSTVDHYSRWCRNKALFFNFLFA